VGCELLVLVDECFALGGEGGVSGVGFPRFCCHRSYADFDDSQYILSYSSGVR
jgi:hypothetical protein